MCKCTCIRSKLSVEDQTMTNFLQFWAGAQKMVHLWSPKITSSLLAYNFTDIKWVALHHVWSQCFHCHKLLTNVEIIWKKTDFNFPLYFVVADYYALPFSNLILDHAESKMYQATEYVYWKCCLVIHLGRKETYQQTLTHPAPQRSFTRQHNRVFQMSLSARYKCMWIY